MRISVFFANKGFSLAEALVSIFLISIVLVSYSKLERNFRFVSHKVIKNADIKSAHNKFQYLLLSSEGNYLTDQSENLCTSSLKGKGHGDSFTIDTKEFKSMVENYKIFNNKAITNKKYKKVKNTSTKAHYALDPKLEIDFDRINSIKNSGYVNAVFKYKNLSNENHQITEKVRIFAELEKQNERYVISRCLLGDLKKQCQENARFLLSFNESSLYASQEQTIGSEDEEREDGKEYVFNSTNMFTESIGEYCLSYNICMDGEWVSSAMCYDSCRNKFWKDGLVSYVDENEFEKTAESDFICPEKRFRIKKSCAGKQIAFNLDAGKFNSIVSDKKIICPAKSVIIDGEARCDKAPSSLTASFSCSYAGTWILDYVECRKYTIDDETKLITGEAPKGDADWGWDIKTAENAFTCPTRNENYIIQSYDYDERKDQPGFASEDYKRTFDLGEIFNNQRSKIGTPRRLLAFFKDSPTAQTIACNDSNEWEQLGDAVKNCDILSASKPAVDIIFIIDNSGSMGDDQAKLAAAVTQFINKLIAAKHINFSITVGTTDRPGGYPILKTNYGAGWTKNSLKKGMRPGARGSGNERPLTYLYRTLLGYSSRYSKPNNHLAIFIITDEDGNNNECLNTNIMINTIAKINQFKKYNKDKVIVRAAINDDINIPAIDKCVRRFAQEYAVGDLHNSVFDIHSPSYGNQMSQFADEIISRIPVLGN